MWYAILAVLLIISSFQWLKWKVITAAHVRWIIDQDIGQPSDKELKELVGWAVSNMVNDFFKIFRGGE